MVSIATAVLVAAATSQPQVCRFDKGPTLAVLDVQVEHLPSDLGALLSNVLRSTLIDTDCFKVQDEAQMREVLATQAANASDHCDQSCAVDAGRVLQVRYLASAQVYADAGGALALARITDVETGTAVASAQSNVGSTSAAAIADVIASLARKLALKDLGANAPRPAEPVAKKGRGSWAWIALGGGVIAGGVGGVLAKLTLDSANAAATPGPPTKFDSAYSTSQSEARAATAAWATAGLLGATALALFTFTDL